MVWPEGPASGKEPPMMSLLLAAAMFAALFWNMTRSDHEFGSAG
jgi:hypothetical protein